MSPTNEQPPLLNIKNLRVTFTSEESKAVAVKDTSFHVQPGEIVGLVGESGSGKSVTGMSILNLIPKPLGNIEKGEIEFKGQNLRQLPLPQLRTLRGQEIGIIFQEPMTALSPLHTIGTQLIETLQLHQSISKQDARLIALEWLDKVGIPNAEERFNAFPFEFSGGMRQRVMIAMVLMLNPSLIIADEPTTALDVTTQQQIFELILKIKEKDSSIIFITHDMGVIWQLCDRVIVMKDAEIVETGSVFEIFESPQNPYTQKLLQAVPRISDSPRRSADKSTLQADSNTLITAKGVQTWFAIKKGLFSRIQGYTKAVDDVSMHINRGEILALVGESGSGKTTLGRTILGLEKATGGSIQYAGHELTQLSRKAFKPLREKLQIVFQDPFSSLNPRMTIQDILTEGLQAQGKLGSSKEDVAVQLLENVHLKADHRQRYPHEFSGGQRQRICIARALSMKPEFIVCDEAVSALDVTIQAQVIDLLIELQEKYNLSYLFISHDLSVVKRIADRVIVMKRGKIVEQGLTSQVIDNPQDTYTQTLIKAVPNPGCLQSRHSIRPNDDSL